MENMMHECVSMKACVKKVCPDHLMVCDCCTGQEVHVHTEKACCFSVGDLVCIKYSGAMTMSIPPQISANTICRINH